MTLRDSSYQNLNPDIRNPSDFGWEAEEDIYKPISCLKLPAPKAVVQLVKCGCVKGCMRGCSCSRNKLPCTELCKCYGDECYNENISENHSSTNDNVDEQEDDYLD